MPYASLWLGYYVVTRPRGDGTHRVLFLVPKHKRPSSWPSQIKLPRAGFRRADGETTGDLTDLDEVDAIRSDAKALHAALRSQASIPAAPDHGAAMRRHGSIPWLIMSWGGSVMLAAIEGRMPITEAALDPGPARSASMPDGASPQWLDIEPRSRRFYLAGLRHVWAWSVTVGHKHVSAMTARDVHDFLSLWNRAPGQRKNVRSALSQLFRLAITSGEISSAQNPLDAVTAPKRKRVKGGRRARVERWTRADVGLYAETARSVKAWRPHSAGRNRDAQRSWPGGAVLIRLMYETSADSTDVITWTKTQHLKTKRVSVSGADAALIEGIEFDRGKTGQAAFIPLSRDLVAEIRANGGDFIVTDPMGAPYRPVIDDARLRGHLITLRERVLAAGGPKRVFDHLRHSAVTEGVEAGIAIDDMMHLTAHADAATNKDFYVQRSAAKALEIQRARGLL